MSIVIAFILVKNKSLVIFIIIAGICLASSRKNDPSNESETPVEIAETIAGFETGSMFDWKVTASSWNQDYFVSETMVRSCKTGD